MRFLVALLLSTTLTCWPAFARYDIYSYQEWTDSMLAKLPFRDSMLTRQAYASVGEEYLKGLVEYYHAVNRKKQDQAIRRGRLNVAARLEDELQGQVGRARRYVRDTEDGLFRSLDPQRQGIIDLEQARALLLSLAVEADFNRNGKLEPVEGDIAEAALVRGVDLGIPADRDQLLRDMDRDSRFFHPLD